MVRFVPVKRRIAGWTLCTSRSTAAGVAAGSGRRICCWAACRVSGSGPPSAPTPGPAPPGVGPSPPPPGRRPPKTGLESDSGYYWLRQGPSVRTPAVDVPAASGNATTQVSHHGCLQAGARRASRKMLQVRLAGGGEDACPAVVVVLSTGVEICGAAGGARVTGRVPVTRAHGSQRLETSIPAASSSGRSSSITSVCRSLPIVRSRSFTAARSRPRVSLPCW